MVEFTLPRADHFEVFHNYWRTLASDAGGVPTRAAFSPAVLKDLLPFVFIIERRSPDDLHIRLAGSAIEQVLGFAATGKNYLEICYKVDAPFFKQVFTDMAEVPCGAFFRRDIHLAGGDIYSLNTRCLPFTDKEGSVRYIIGVAGVGNNLVLTAYDPPVLDFSNITAHHYIDVGFGLPDESPALPPAKTIKPDI